MSLIVKASDLKFKYPRDVKRRAEAKFSGLPDPAPFNRNDLYEVLPIMSAAMDALESQNGRVLHLLEDILNEMPRFIITREEVYNYLVECGRDVLRG
jgi:hypothetical protein